MNNKKSIAATHGVDLNYFEIRNVIVKNISVLNVLGFLFLLIFGLIFLIMAILEKTSALVLGLGVTVGIILLICSFVFFMDIFLFKIEFKEGCIDYWHFGKHFNFNVSNIRYFKAEMDGRARFYDIQIVFNNNKKINYTISQANKENFVFLLNLLKMGVKQI